MLDQRSQTQRERTADGPEPFPGFISGKKKKNTHKKNKLPLINAAVYALTSVWSPTFTVCEDPIRTSRSPAEQNDLFYVQNHHHGSD